MREIKLPPISFLFNLFQVSGAAARYKTKRKVMIFQRQKTGDGRSHRRTEQNFGDFEIKT